MLVRATVEDDALFDCGIYELQTLVYVHNLTRGICEARTNSIGLWRYQ